MGLLDKLQYRSLILRVFPVTTLHSKSQISLLRLPFFVTILIPLQHSLIFLFTGIELFRLEQRYTRRKRRTTFISNAQYVDGEYVYTSPVSEYAGEKASARGRRQKPTA